MSRSTMAALLGPEFDAFLFAPVDENGKGVLLSVLSALARLDLDPWREAAELAGMPRAASSRRLTSLLATLPNAPAAPETIADRLIALLPHRDRSSVVSRANSLRADPMPTSHTVVNMILINLLLMAGMLCAQWALAGLQPGHVATTRAAASGTVVPHATLPPAPALPDVGE